jgi:hypothetical protein
MQNSESLVYVTDGVIRDTVQDESEHQNTNPCHHYLLVYYSTYYSYLHEKPLSSSRMSSLFTGTTKYTVSKHVLVNGPSFKVYEEKHIVFGGDGIVPSPKVSRVKKTGDPLSSLTAN